jgi:putative heme transporter
VSDRERGGNGATSPVERLWRAGRTAWAFVGLAVVVVLLGFVAAELAVLVVPVILALFPATLLVPVARWMKDRGAPDAVASLATVVAGVLLIVGVFVGLVPIVAAQLPDLVSSAGEGIGELQETLEGYGIEVGGVSELMESAREQAPEAGEFAGQAMDAAVVTFEAIAGLIILLVVLFFYLKDGRRLANGLISTTPARMRPQIAEMAESSWGTLGSYFRGQLLVALVDAVLIGIGLLVVGVPLAIPLAVLIFFGGLFPIVGALVTGTLAVLVAFADAGLTAALIVLAIILVVQQLESNVLEPVILGRAIHLHPLVVLLSLTAGALLFGILGAFLAVPVAAIIADVTEHLREHGVGGTAEDPEVAADAPAEASA